MNRQKRGKKQDKTGRNRKEQKNWKKKTPKTEGNWMILKETGRNRKKQKETRRNKKKPEETGRNRKKHEETVRNSKKQ